MALAGPVALARPVALAETGGTGATGGHRRHGCVGQSDDRRRARPVRRWYGRIHPVRPDSGATGSVRTGRRRPRAAGRPDPPVAERPVPRRLPGGPDHRPGGCRRPIAPIGTGHVRRPRRRPCTAPDRPRRAPRHRRPHRHSRRDPQLPAADLADHAQPLRRRLPLHVPPPRPRPTSADHSHHTAAGRCLDLGRRRQLAALSGGSASTSVVIENSGGVAAAAGSVSIATPPGVSVSGFEHGSAAAELRCSTRRPGRLHSEATRATMTTCQLPEIAAGDTVTATLTLDRRRGRRRRHRRSDPARARRRCR